MGLAGEGTAEGSGRKNRMSARYSWRREHEEARAKQLQALLLLRMYDDTAEEGEPATWDSYEMLMDTTGGKRLRAADSAALGRIARDRRPVPARQARRPCCV